ncbi:conserved unknown protein [Ectocarpus siliculosus]|uniref:Protein ENHANCED DISEASE RESISTANCE 2 C-terminal domain-containing protein n=1 Tax=Ectocarpus siliculosus TaxID=2880 RepID=D7FTZ3_ECTSI|nr:conserved unknown protein [Ectocarpus siliculosus]|eukprot:CBJ31520.1 conserved unknown protein [Ectocarpus siliculosus]
MEQTKTYGPLRSGGEQQVTPSTPPAVAGLDATEYASDPESAGVGGRRVRRLGLPGKMRVGKRGRGTTAAASTSAGVVGHIDDITAPDIGADAATGAAAAAATAAGPDGRGAGGARRPSAGSRLGAMLRRGAPSLNHLRRSGSKASSLSSPQAEEVGDLAIPALGISPRGELDDPPERHASHDSDRRGGAAVAPEVSTTSSLEPSSNSSGRRRFHRSKGAAGGVTRVVSHRDARAGSDIGPRGDGGGGGIANDQRRYLGASSAEDALEYSDGGRHGGGGGGVFAAARSNAKVPSLLARKSSSKTLAAARRHGDCDEQVAFWSGSDLDSSGDNNRGRRPPPPAAAAAASRPDNAAALRRDRSAPPCGHSAAEVAGERRGIQQSMGEARHTLDGSARPKDDPPGGRKRNGDARGRAADGYKSAPDDLHRESGRVGPAAAAAAAAASGGGGGVPVPDGECIAIAEAALFSAMDTTSDAEVGAGGGGAGGGGGFSGQGQGSMASSDEDDDEEEEEDDPLSSRGTSTAAAATVERSATASAAAGGGKAATVRKRRRISELLGFRRRTTSGVNASSSLSSSLSGAPGVSASGAADDGAGTGGGGSVPRNGETAEAMNRSTGGRGTSASRRGTTSTTAPPPPRRQVLYRSNSTSALDRADSGSYGEAEDVPAGAGTGKPAGGGRKGASGRRRLLPGGSSSVATAAAASSGSARGLSASPLKHRRHRHRDSLLEAGKDKLRRGRSKLSRGSFGGRSSSSSQRPLRAPSPVADTASTEGSSKGRKPVTEEMDGGAAKRGPVEPAEQGPPAKPQLGTTYAKRPDSSPLDPGAPEPWNSWTVGSGSQFNVRTKGYGRTKVKAPSAPELYQLISIDAYRSPAGRICGVYPLFTPPAFPTAATPAGGGSATDSVEGARRTGTGDEDPPLSQGPGGCGGGSSSSCCSGTGDDTGHPDIPPVLVVNFQLPDLPTPFTVQGDGPTLHIILTFHATRRLCRYAARVWAEERSAAAAAAGTGGGEEGQAGSPEATPAAASETAAVEPLGSGAPSGDAAPGGGDATANGGPVPHGRSSHGAPPAEGGAGLGEGDAEDVPESVRLLVEWMRRAQDDGNFRGRFKAIGDIVNMDEVGLPSIARRFSGKPILLYGKESSMVKGPGYVELDLNAHAFSYVGRKGLYVTLEKWKRAVFRIGFLLEGRTDEEQPEHILGCGVFHGLDLDVLSELSLSADGERLIATNTADGENAAAVSDISESGSGSIAANSSAAPNGRARGSAVDWSYASGGRSKTRRYGDVTPPSASSSSSAVVPLVPKRHMDFLLRCHIRGKSSSGDGGGGVSFDVNPDKAVFGNGIVGFDTHDEDDQDSDVTVTAVAAAAFAGGWFCALLAMITIACWSELSVVAQRGPDGGEGPWRTSFSAWLVACV